MTDVHKHAQITAMRAWEDHEGLVKERVKKTLARDRNLSRDFRQVLRAEEHTVFIRMGVAQRWVECGKAEATHVLFTRQEWMKEDET